MPNSVIDFHFSRNPNETRSPEELTVLLGDKRPDLLEQFPDFAQDYTRIKEARARLAEPTTAERYLTQPVGAFVRGAADVVASIPESVAAASQIVERKAADMGLPFASMERATGALDEGYVTGRLATGIRNLGNRIAPAPVEGLEDSALSTGIPGALGSSVAFLGSGAAGRLLKAGTATIASMGSAAMSSQLYNEAIAAGATPEQATKAYVGGLAAGASEILPLGKMLNRLDKLAAGGFMRALVNATKEAPIEALQEAFQSAAGDVIAAKWAGYDPDRNMFADIAEDAGIGGASGAILSLVMSGIGARIRPMAEQQATKEVTEDFQKANVKQTLSNLAQYSEGDLKDRQVEELIDLAKKEETGSLTIAEEETIKNFSPERESTFALVRTGIKRPLTAQEEADLRAQIQERTETYAQRLESKLSREIAELDSREQERAREEASRIAKEQEATAARRARFDALREEARTLPAPIEGGETVERQIQEQRQEGQGLLTPSPATETTQPAAAPQTITGSNLETATEMPVSPQASARAGGVVAPSIRPLMQTPMPDRFESIQDVLAFRRARINDDVSLFMREIGLTRQQAERLFRIIQSPNGDTSKLEKEIGPEKAERLNYFFDESEFNRVDGPWRQWETDQRLNPEEVAGESDIEALSSYLTTAVARGVEASPTSDRFISAIIAARRLQEIGGTKSDIARYVDKYSTRESSGQSDKEFFFRRVAGKVNAFLEAQGIQLADGDLSRVGRRGAARAGAVVASPATPVLPRSESAGLSENPPELMTPEDVALISKVQYDKTGNTTTDAVGRLRAMFGRATIESAIDKENPPLRGDDLQKYVDRWGSSAPGKLAAGKATRLAILSKNFFAGDAKVRTLLHAASVSEAARVLKPVSAVAADAYGIKLPEGYVRQGDLYVFQPGATGAPAQAAPPVAEVAQATAPGPVSDLVDLEKHSQFRPDYFSEKALAERPGERLASLVDGGARSNLPGENNNPRNTRLLVAFRSKDNGGITQVGVYKTSKGNLVAVNPAGGKAVGLDKLLQTHDPIHAIYTKEAQVDYRQSFNPDQWQEAADEMASRLSDALSSGADLAVAGAPISGSEATLSTGLEERVVAGESAEALAIERAGEVGALVLKALDITSKKQLNDLPRQKIYEAIVKVLDQDLELVESFVRDISSSILKDTILRREFARIVSDHDGSEAGEKAAAGRARNVLLKLGSIQIHEGLKTIPTPLGGASERAIGESVLAEGARVVEAGLRSGAEAAFGGLLRYARVGRGVVTPQQDAEYLAAVERGDMETAQRMVDGAAKAAGYNVGPVWHGTDREFTEFDPNQINRASAGFYFAHDSAEAERYATIRTRWNGRENRIVRAFLNPGIAATSDDVGGIKEAKEKGFDSFTTGDTKDDVWVVYDPNRIKSANPVTRDSSGKVIPLSARFNEASPDIRYAQPGQVSIPPRATQSQVHDAMMGVAHAIGTEGYRLAAIQAGANEVATELFGAQGGGVTDPERRVVILAMQDAINPTEANLVVAMNELGHVYFQDESESMRRAILSAVNSLGDTELGFRNVLADPRLNDGSMNAQELLEERLVGAASEQADVTSARSLVRRFMDFFRQLYLRSILELQRIMSGLNIGEINPRTAVNYYRLRIENAVRGNPMRTVFSFIGRPIEPWEAAPVFDSTLGKLHFPVRYNGDTGMMELPRLIEDTVDAIRLNALGLRFAKVGYATHGINLIPSDLTGAEASTGTAMLNTWNSALNMLWQRFAVSPLNRTTTGQPVFTDGRKFSEFLLKAAGMEHPLDLLNEKVNLFRNAGKDIDSTITLDTLPRHSRPLAIKDAAATLDKMLTKLGEEYQRIEGDMEANRKRLDKLARRTENAALQAKNAEALMDEVRDEFRESISELRRGLNDIRMTGLATGRLGEALGQIEGKMDEPVADEYISLLNALHKRLAKKEDSYTIKFFDTLEYLSQMEMDWAGSSVADIRDHIRTAARAQNASELLRGLEGDTRESKAISSLVASFLRRNDMAMELMKIRREKLEGEYGQMQEVFKTLISDEREGVNRARVLANKLSRTSKAAQKVIDRYEQLRKQREELANENSYNVRFVNTYSLLAKPLFDEVIRLKGMVGAVRPFEANAGEEYTVPLDVTARSPNDWAKRKFSVDSESGRIPERVIRDAEAIQKWLDAVKPEDPEYMSGRYQQMALYAEKLREAIMYGQYLRERNNNAMVNLGGALPDVLRSLGNFFSTRAAGRIGQYKAIKTANEQDLRRMGDQWAGAAEKLWEKVRVDKRDMASFLRVFYDAPLAYIRSRVDIRDSFSDQEAAFDAALGEALKLLRSDPYVKDNGLMPNDVAEEWKSFIKLSVRNSQHIVNLAKKYKIKVEDAKEQGFFRDVLGAGGFEMKLDASPKLVEVFMKMGTAGWNEKAPGYRDVLAAYNENRDGLVEAMNPLFTPFIWDNFVREFALDPDRGHFTNPAGTAAVSSTNSQQAFFESSNVVEFAEKLFELEGGGGDRAEYVADVINTFTQHYETLKAAAPVKDTEKRLIDIPGGGGVLLSGRYLIDLPRGLVKHRIYDRANMAQMLESLAMTAAFGQNNQGMVGDLTSAIAQLKQEADAYTRLQERAKDAVAHKGVPAIRREMAELAGGMEKLERMENAYAAHNAAKKALATFDQIVSNHGGLSHEYQPAHKIVGTVAFNMVQGGATGLVDIMGSVVKPLMAFGPSKQAFSMIANALTNQLPRSIGQSFANLFGLHLNFLSNQMKQMHDAGQSYASYSTKIQERLASTKMAVDQTAESGFFRKGALLTTGGFGAVQEATNPFYMLGAQAQEGEVRVAPPITIAAPYSTASGTARVISSSSLIKEYEDIVLRAVSWFDQVGGTKSKEFNDLSFKFKPEDLGYNDGMLLQDAFAFSKQAEALTYVGTSVETLARDYIRRAGDANSRVKGREPLLTARDVAGIVTISGNLITQEGSIMTRAAWMERNPALKIAAPLLSWSMRQAYSVRDTFRDANGKRAWKSGTLAVAATLPLALAFSFLRDWYDEEVLGKQANVMPLSTEDPELFFQSAVDRISRMGTFGLLSELPNSIINPDNNRPFTLDNRLVITNMYRGISQVVSNLYNQDFTSTYATVRRNLFGALGGAGWLQNAQAFNNLIYPIFGSEARYAARVNANNHLRVAGRMIGLDVRTGFGGGQVVSTPIRPWVTEMVLSAIANDASRFRESYENAVQATMRHKELNRADAEKYVAQSYRSYTPLQATFKTAPTQQDYARILGVLDDSGREDVMEAVRLTDMYGRQIGALAGTKKERRPRTQDINQRMRELSGSRMFGGDIFGRSPYGF